MVFISQIHGLVSGLSLPWGLGGLPGWSLGEVLPLGALILGSMMSGSLLTMWLSRRWCGPGASADTALKIAQRALQDSETRFQQLAEAVQEGFFVYETATAHYSYVNSAYWTIRGCSPDLSPDSMEQWMARIHPGDRSRIEAALVRERAGEPFDQEYRYTTPAGDLRWLRSKAFPLGNAAGEVVRIVGTVEDITDRKRTEAALQESETRFRQLAEGVKEGFFVFETGSGDDSFEDGHYSYRNPAYWDIRDMAPDDAPGCIGRWLLAIHPNDRPRIEVALKRQIQQLTSVEEEYRYVTPSGELRWLRSSSFPLCDEAGKVVRVVGTVENITDRKRAEAALRQSEDRFRRAFDYAPYGISLVSTTGQFVLANAYYCALLGYTEAELLTLTFKTITHPDDWEEDWQGFQRMMNHKVNTYQIEKRYLTKQGQSIPVIVNAAPIYDADGQPLYSVGHVQDIRDRIAIDRMKDEFISVVSHELRTPITAIQGALAMLGTGLYDNRPQKAQRMLNIAIANSNRLVRLVDDILSFERLESGQVQLEKEACQVATLMYQAIDSVQALADQSGITVTTTPINTTLWAAPDAIIQMLINLLSNAIKFSAPGQTVRLRAEAGVSGSPPPPARLPSQPATMLFMVQDQGRGIPADKLELIFDQFQQVDASDSRLLGGAGLGLAICKRIVQQHGGQIWVESTVNQGSTFYVTIPLTGDLSHG